VGAAGIHRPKGIGDPLEFVAFTLATEKHREICTALMFAIPASLLALECRTFLSATRHSSGSRLKGEPVSGVSLESPRLLMEFGGTLG
jgi:hypothetical protein